MARPTKPMLDFFDLAMIDQGVELPPMFQAISDFLDDDKEIIEKVAADLNRGLKNPNTGRRGMSPSQVLRSLILMRIKNWPYRELSERIADGYTLRRFTDFHAGRVPDHNAFHRALSRLTPTTIRTVNEVMIKTAIALGLEDGNKLRVDTTVVETDIHHPTDSTLMWDAVRILTRLVRRLGDAVLPLKINGFRDRTRAARRRMFEIQRMTSRDRFDRLVPTYRALIDIAEEVKESARAAIRRTAKVRGRTLLVELELEELRKKIEHFCSLAERVISQARRRVLDGETVPSNEKIYSIFEPHTDLIKRGKVQKPVEFGHKVFLAESAQGLITQYEVLAGNPKDEVHVASSLKRHQATFASVPDLYCADRGFYSERNLTSCAGAGVALACIPQSGGGKTPQRAAFERSAPFKAGQRFRAGVEGRISVLCRGRGMRRCSSEGLERFEAFVGAAVLANNLMRIGTLLSC